MISRWYILNIKNRLQNYSRLSQEVDQLADQVFSLRQTMYSIKSSSDMSLIPASSGNHDKIGDIVAKIADLENNYLHKIDGLMQEQRDLEKLIEKLEPVERLLIRTKYIECKTFEEVAVLIGYTWRHTIRLHGNILDKLNKQIQQMH